MVYSTDRSKAVVQVLILLFVALWFILRGDLLYVFPCVILFLCFLVLLVLRLPRLGKRNLILMLFVRLFDLCLFGFVGFLFLLGSGKACSLWLWHSLDFSLTFFFQRCWWSRAIKYTEETTVTMILCCKVDGLMQESTAKRPRPLWKYVVTLMVSCNKIQRKDHGHYAFVFQSCWCNKINVKKIAFETKNTLRIRKWKSRFYWDSS